GSALEDVANECRRGQTLAPGAQHVGRADVAGADVADVARAGPFREDQAEGDRAEQIPDQKPDDGLRCVHRHPPDAEPCHEDSYTVRPATMVRTARPCIRASSNGVLRHFDLSVSRSRIQGTSGSITTMSAMAPGCSVPPARPSSSAGRVEIALSSFMSAISP